MLVGTYSLLLHETLAPIQEKFVQTVTKIMLSSHLNLLKKTT
jgi:hypothetical protein